MPFRDQHTKGVEFEKHKVDKESQARDFRASWRWRKRSEAIRSRYPLCQAPFHGEGRIEPSTQVHHIYSVNDFYGLRLHPANCIPICDMCHDTVNAMANRKQDIIKPFQDWIKQREEETGRILIK